MRASAATLSRCTKTPRRWSCARTSACCTACAGRPTGCSSSASASSAASASSSTCSSTRCSCTASGSSTASPPSLAWLVAVLNNFVLNRHWTFDARGGQAHLQAIRFLLVSLVAEVVSLLLLTRAGRGRRDRQDPRAGARGRRRDAAQLPRQQALELPVARLSAAPRLGVADTPARVSRRPEIRDLYSDLDPCSEDLCAGDGDLRRQLRHGWQAADRAAEDR